MNKIKVSICCITYNHEDYIEEAINGFLMQQINFPIEILIHDDASTDKTPEIIEEYRKKNPDIIKVIYQKENQYSKGIKISPKYLWSNAQGEYIALCEGDDYWTDDTKLKKQVEYLEKNKDVTMCIHAAEVKNYGELRTEWTHIRPFKESRKITINEMISLGAGFFPTASLVFRKDCVNNIPDFYFKCSVGDYPLSLILASQGNIYYIDELMSVYRFQVPGSWTANTYKKRDTSKVINNYKSDIFILNEFNKYTSMKYIRDINIVIMNRLISIDQLQGKKVDLKSKEYKTLLLAIDNKEKIKILLRLRYEKIYKLLLKIKRITG